MLYDTELDLFTHVLFQAKRWCPDKISVREKGEIDFELHSTEYSFRNQR
jgi:hypothetical protein